MLRHHLNPKVNTIKPNQKEVFEMTLQRDDTSVFLEIEQLGLASDIRQNDKKMEKPSLRKLKKQYEQQAPTNRTEVNHLCVNKHHSQDTIAQFFCLREHVYLCDECFESHRDHVGLDSIANHLTHLFNQWKKLEEYAYKFTKAQLDQNLKKHKQILTFLKKYSEIQPDIDAFTLPLILQNLVSRLAQKIQILKEVCQKNNLNQALQMISEFKRFKTQIQELENRSQITSLIAIYLVPNGREKIDPLLVNINLFQDHVALTKEQKMFIMRKSFDFRMNSLKIQLQKQKQYMNHQEQELQQLQEIELNQESFEDQFENLFAQKLKVIKERPRSFDQNSDETVPCDFESQYKNTNIFLPKMSKLQTPPQQIKEIQGDYNDFVWNNDSNSSEARKSQTEPDVLDKFLNQSVSSKDQMRESICFTVPDEIQNSPIFDLTIQQLIQFKN